MNDREVARSCKSVDIGKRCATDSREVAETWRRPKRNSHADRPMPLRGVYLRDRG
jgi:hypothetical protein